MRRDSTISPGEKLLTTSLWFALKGHHTLHDVQNLFPTVLWTGNFTRSVQTRDGLHQLPTLVGGSVSLWDMQNKKPSKFGGFCVLARPDGFEPPTPWFVARYSIQLSYGRLVFKTCQGGIIQYIHVLHPSGASVAVAPLFRCCSRHIGQTLFSGSKPELGVKINMTGKSLSY